MDKIVSGDGQVQVRRIRTGGLGWADLAEIVIAADEFVVAGLCGDSQSEALDKLLRTLRRYGLADS